MLDEQLRLQKEANEVIQQKLHQADQISDSSHEQRESLNQSVALIDLEDLSSSEVDVSTSDIAKLVKKFETIQAEIKAKLPNEDSSDDPQFEMYLTENISPREDRFQIHVERTARSVTNTINDFDVDSASSRQK